MNQKEVSERLTNDLVHLKPGTFTETEIELIKDRIHWAYAVGYEYGRIVKEGSRAEPVVKLDKYGKAIKKFPTIKEAAKEAEVHWKTISKVIHSRQHSAKGYVYMLLSDYETVHK